MSDKFIPTYKWNLSDLSKVEKNNLKVFSCFACGGGSTMGYKLAGYDVIGANDIDPEMAWHYKENHKPKYYYLEDIRKFRQRTDLPKELFNLDILDGSPPCSSFSMAGSREKGWGKKKVFREGQASQILDDLFFDFIELSRKLQPKVVIAENVKGLIQGNAKGYVKQIINLFKVSGYNVQLYLLNAATMGVPQSRERVFFICHRQDLKLKDLKMTFNERPITAINAVSDLLEIKSDYQLPVKGIGFKLWRKCKEGKSLSSVNTNKNSWIGHIKTLRNKPFHTLNASNNGGKMHYRWDYPVVLPFQWWIRAFSFPENYNFKNINTARYLMGMSVPPLMTYAIARQVYEQWFTGQTYQELKLKSET